MKSELSYLVKDIEVYKSKLMFWASHFDTCCILQSNRIHEGGDSMNSFGSSYDLLVAAGETGHFEGGGSRSFEGLKEFCANKDRWAFGFLSYDLKNELEDLKSENYDGIGMPDIHFFNPEFLFLINGNEIILKAEGDSQLVERIKEEIDSMEYTSLQNDKIQSVSQRISREDYLKCVKEIKDHIRYGNVYELNLCR